MDAIKNPARRKEFLASRALMRRMLSEIFPVRPEQWQFQEQDNASPWVSNLPDGVHVNLSHSKGFICFAIADVPVGIDIEVRDPTRNFTALAKLFMSDAERTRLSREARQSDYFYRCWCIKEAYYKAQPRQRQDSLSFNSIEVENFDPLAEGWYLTEGRIEDCYLAVICRHRPISVQCRYYPDPADWPQPFVEAVT